MKWCCLETFTLLQCVQKSYSRHLYLKWNLKTIRLHTLAWILASRWVMKPMKCQRKFKLKKDGTCNSKLQQLVKSFQVMPGTIPPHPFTWGCRCGLKLPFVPTQTCRTIIIDTFLLTSDIWKGCFPDQGFTPEQSTAHVPELGNPVQHSRHYNSMYVISARPASKGMDPRCVPASTGVMQNTAWMDCPISPVPQPICLCLPFCYALLAEGHRE